MILWLNIITTITVIHTCILRKRQHCIEYQILKDREYPDYVVKLPNKKDNSVQNDVHQKKIKLFSKEDADTRTSSLKETHSKISLTALNLENRLNSHDYIKKPVKNEKKSNNLSDIQINTVNLMIYEIDKLIFSRQIEKLLNIIERYMSLYMSEVQMGHYLSRLGNINQIYEYLIENEHQYKNYNSIFTLCDLKLYEILNCVILKFESNKTFLGNNYDDFISILFRSIYLDKDLKQPLVNSKSNSTYDKKFLFCYEFIKCAKYFSDIPELLTLGNVFSKIITFDLIFSIHLINLLLETKDTKEVKVFVLFLIRRAYLNSVKKRIDFFSVCTLNTYCWENLNNLHQCNVYFFLWEMISHKRHDIQAKMKGRNMLLCSRIDQTHLKSVLFIFVYQQMIFLKFNNSSEDEYEKYVLLIDNIIEEGNCPICDFKKFIKLLKESDKLF